LQANTCSSSLKCLILDNNVASNTRIEKSWSFRKIYRSFRSLNLFAAKPSSAVTEVKREEIIATRIYIFLFLLSLGVALLYVGPLSEETKTRVIKLPTSDIVNDLHAKNIPTLSCPCSTAAIRRSKFLSIIPHYHSICSSDYVIPSYYIDLYKKRDKISRRVSTHYRILAAFCQQTHRTIKSAQDVFGARDLVNVEAMTRSSFIIRTEALVLTFISQIPADYRRTLTFIMRSFGVNHLLTLFTTNWKLNYTDEDENYVIATSPYRFPSSNCTCATSFDCTEPVLDSIVSGCFPFDGFRLSKFQNVSMGELNDKLFVETWNNESNYTAYFEACHPLECRYTLPDRNDPLIMLTTVLGLYGGK
jgi:hypothetical protein